MPSAIPQPVVAELTRAAIFLVVTVNAGPDRDAAVRALCGDLAALLRAVGFRDLEGRLSCVMAFGSDAWDRLFGVPKPKELHPYRGALNSRVLKEHVANTVHNDSDLLGSRFITQIQQRMKPEFVAGG